MTIAVFLENRPFFGAVLTHIPLLHALRRRHPQGRIVVFAPFNEAGLLVRCGCADEARVYRRGILGLIRELRRLRPGEIYLLRPRSQWLELAVGASRAPVRAGFRSVLTRLFFSRTVTLRTDIYRPRKYLLLIPEENGTAAPAPSERPGSDSLAPWFRDAAAGLSPLPVQGLLRQTAHARILAVLPGGGAGAFKLWGIGNFIALCQALAAEDPDLRFLFVLGAAEAQYRRRVESSAIASRAAFLVDRPPAELAAAAFASAAAVGNDCGPGHIFQMCGRPFACVLSNHDGRVAARIAEWIDERNRPHALFPSAGEDASRVAVEEVRRVVTGILRQAPRVLSS